MKAPINRIINFSNVDGPGNRCSIFFQACSFKCLYCHNPETIHRCNNCGECIETCPVQALSLIDGKVVWDKQKCVNCDTCIKVCKHSASPKIEELEVEELVERIKKVKPFIRGITVSGGECMLHANYLLELFKEVKKLGLTCLIDSNGSIDFRRHQELLDVCDGVMLDIKAVDEEFHEALCGRKNDRVLNNLEYLLSVNKLEEVRTVLLPRYMEESRQTVDYVSKKIQDKCIYKLLRYRPFGVKEQFLEVLGTDIFALEDAHELQDLAIKNGAIHTKTI